MDPTKILFGLLALPLILGITGAYWKKTIVFLMYWTVLCGAFRKWFLPQMVDITLFFSHFLLLGVYGRFFLGGRRLPSQSAAFLFLMILLSSLCLLSLFNPRLPDIRVGIVGNVIYLFFVPLAFIVPSIFPSKEKLLRFIKEYSFFSLPILILGIVQYFSPTGSLINQYVAESMDIAMVGSHARITGTFSYLSGYTTYLNVLVILLVYLMSVQTAGTSVRLKVALLSLLAAINLFMTGSRGLVGISIISILLYLVIAARLGATFVSKLVLRFILLGGMALAVLSLSRDAKIAFDEAFSAFKERVEGTVDIGDRLVDTFTPFKFVEKAGLFGYGVGTTYQGAERFDIDWGAMPRNFEEEPERVVLELGVIGYLIVYGFRLYLILAFWQLHLRLRDRDLKLLALAILLFQVQFLQLSNLVFNLTSGVFYWFFSGFIFLLPKLDHGAVEREQTANSGLPPR